MPLRLVEVSTVRSHRNDKQVSRDQVSTKTCHIEVTCKLMVTGCFPETLLLPVEHIPYPEHLFKLCCSLEQEQHWAMNVEKGAVSEVKWLSNNHLPLSVELTLEAECKEQHAEQGGCSFPKGG